MIKTLTRISKWFKRETIVETHSSSRQFYVVGYPKCGTTWLRVMLGKYVQLLTGRDEKLPLPLFDRFEDFDMRVPLIQFTHGNLDWTHQTAADLTLENTVLCWRHTRIVLLVRNIPDVVVSLFWQAKTQSNPPYMGNISEFIRDPVQGVEKAVRFLQLWDLGRSSIHQLLLMRYEDLRFNPNAEFRRLLDFFQMPINEDYLGQAIAFSDFNNMRKLEVDNRRTRALVYSSSGLPIFATGDTTSTPEAFHVRKGRVGGYRDYLSDGDIQFLRDAMWGKIPEWYKYPDGFWSNDVNPA